MWVRNFAAVGCSLLLMFSQALAEAPAKPAPAPLEAKPSAEAPPKTKVLLTDAAIVAAIIAASIVYYKSSSGGPCACPGDTDRAGHRCGKRSAHDRPGGYSVTCFANEVGAEMIAGWRKEYGK